MTIVQKLSMVFAGAALSATFLTMEAVQAHPGHSPLIPPDISAFSEADGNQVLIVPSDASDRPMYVTTSGITTFLAVSSETNQEFSLFLDVIPVQGGAIPHIHSREDEFYYILEGTSEVTMGSQTNVVGPGNLLFLPKGHRHGFQNIGTTPLKLLVFVTPSGFEGFFSEQNRPVIDPNNPPPPNDDFAELGQIAQKYGTQLALDPNTPSLNLSPLDFLISQANDPNRLSFSENGMLYTSLATSEETGGQFSLFDVFLQPQASSQQRNLKEGDSFYVLDGNLSFQIGDTTSVATPGTYVYLPKDTPYTFQNLDTTPVRTLLLQTSTSIPEPTTTLGLFSFATVGILTKLLNRQKPKI